MSQHDYNIANQTFPSTRSDINSVLGAIATSNSGATEPTTTFAYQWWMDTTDDLLKLRNGSDTAWIIVGKLDTSNDRWEVRANIIQAVSALGIQLNNSGGTQMGLLDATGLQVDGTTDHNFLVNATEVGRVDQHGFYTPGHLRFTERAARPVDPAAGEITLWAKSDAPNVLVMTDDTLVDRILAFAEANKVRAHVGNGTGGTSLSWQDFQVTRFDRQYARLDNLRPTADGTSMVLQLSNDLGLTYRDSAAYDWQGLVVTNGTVSAFTGAAASGFTVARDYGNAANEHGISGTICIMNAASATRRTSVHVKTHYRRSNGNIETLDYMGECIFTEAHNAARVRDGSGIASGQIRWLGDVA